MPQQHPVRVVGVSLVALALSVPVQFEHLPPYTHTLSEQRMQGSIGRVAVLCRCSVGDLVHVQAECVMSLPVSELDVLLHQLHCRVLLLERLYAARELTVVPVDGMLLVGSLVVFQQLHGHLDVPQSLQQPRTRSPSTASQQHHSAVGSTGGVCSEGHG